MGGKPLDLPIQSCAVEEGSRLGEDVGFAISAFGNSAKADVNGAELTGSVGNITGSWILLTIHFSTRLMNFGAEIFAALPSTKDVYVRLPEMNSC